MISRFIILSILVVTTSKKYVFASPSNDTDQEALLSFKASITDDPLRVLASWNNSIHFCHWTGVTCSHKRQRVTSLRLTLKHLVVGTLSPYIGNLSFLREIYLYGNNFHGSVPNEVGRLFRLQYLILRNNSFQGGVPANLSHCVAMREISMYNNNLEGKLPTEFASWPKIERIDLAKNHFTGSIPPSIGNISSLLLLYLDENNLAGGIPLEIAHLVKLETLVLGMNDLSGTVPPPLYNISSMYKLGLYQNDLKGTLPPDFGVNFPQLEHFSLSGNRFSGLLPPSITNASNLIIIDMAENNITGPIPNNLGSLPNLQLLDLGLNPLGNYLGSDDLSFFNSLVNCTHLNELGLYDNGLTGELPSCIVNLSISIEQLYMYENYIYGSIPREIGKLVNMKVISLFRNLFTGSIPESIGELANLGILDLQENNISGVIPTSISNITHLIDLALSHNMLQGNVPAKLFRISTIQSLSVDNNRLIGIIPEEIMFSSECIFLILSKNLFTGPLPSNIGSLKHLTTLDLSYNRLTGDVPANLAACVMLEKLHMEGNHFQGKIPSSFKALKSLSLLDLSNNNISGSIPSFFDTFHLITFLNLSHNKLEGEVSKDGLFSNISAFSIIGNLELCGGIQALHLHSCPTNVLRNKKKIFGLRKILLLVLLPFGFLLLCLALICYRRRNFKKLKDLIPVLMDNQFPQLSYQDLLLATNEFSPDNMLGRGRYGSVYKGVLKAMEQIVAVKVLNVEIHRAKKTFLAECQTLREIRHRNLIKIITAYSTIDFKGNDFKALVFEYMANGSVDNWLHPSPSHQRNERNLTLLQRLNISIDVAMGLDYLHHHSHESIIHCDIKPSNILLDEDFVAHIGDFGFARFSHGTTSDVNQTQTSSTSVHGTFGYVPPEYGIGGEVSTKGDVYSYGILLLEIFSGKCPTESSILKDGYSNLHNYVRAALPRRVMDIADPQIVLDQEEHGLTVNQSYSRASMKVCLTSIFEVGILCSEELPQKRIDINVAIKRLQAAQDTVLQHRQ
ncbi:probable LRR receptor-like serine/threonine-protein kinase At3g47570 [Daucus carota subsp. sativus]|uniref:probable LRR receptor-like serine/threonine-protein kinase At3g47570 n=1 Tax=Daucus carota subsp. sativus TaxID=79200 RepID=UPI0030833A86